MSNVLIIRRKVAPRLREGTHLQLKHGAGRFSSKPGLGRKPNSRSTSVG